MEPIIAPIQSTIHVEPVKERRIRKLVNVLKKWKHAPLAPFKFVFWGIMRILSFNFLLIFFLFYRFAFRIFKIRLIPAVIRLKALSLIDRVYRKFTTSKTPMETISRVNLIEMALRNMFYKKSRAIITVGGMAVGVGSIVFLVSIGYGLQTLVIARVARLDELRQADVSTQPGSREKINDATLARLVDMPEIDKSLPMIASVARVNFNNSVSDVPVYAVTQDYLSASAVKPIHGDLFESNDLVLAVNSDQDGKVAGIETELIENARFKQEMGKVSFEILPNEWLKVRQSPSREGKVLGYTRRATGVQDGVEVWGGVYQESGVLAKDVDSGEDLAPWIKGEFGVWSLESCDKSDDDCVDGKYRLQTDNTGSGVAISGYVAEVNMKIVSQRRLGKVLGIQVLGEDIVASDEASLEASVSADLGLIQTADGWVEVGSDSASLNQAKQVDLPPSAKRQAVINGALVSILGLNPAQAVGKTMSVSFVVVSDLLGVDEKLESVAQDYTIVGVVPDDKTPYFYVPFIDLRGLGVVNYSQLKVVAKNNGLLADARKKIESLGFSTRSVADTVTQIERLFATLRTVLAVLGIVALLVAALGMFNTLTVSLLERTREVGLMKAMGMKSHEVQELFLAESMVMGFFGGLLGIFMGWALGQLAGLGLSIFTVPRGLGYLNISDLPLGFALGVFSLSLLVGVGTGVYPARRATNISALNAMRYE